jgi:nitrite reductase (NAD(P)H)
MPEGSLSYHLNSLVTEVDSEKKVVTTAKGDTIEYDILVLATGSNALLPRVIPGHDATGVFVYRTIMDLQKLIAFSATKKGTAGVVVGGGLLGLEAAKAMMDLEEFGQIKVIESVPYVLGRQVDSEGNNPSPFLSLKANAAKAAPWSSSRSETWASILFLAKW